MTQSLAQLRAKDALGTIKELQRLAELPGKTANEVYGNYVSYVKALPATIIMSGLGQALAMENSGKKKGHKLLYEHMNAWLCNVGGHGWQNSPYRHKDNVLDAITSLDEDAYIRAQAETMEYLEWLKKFAVAFLVEKEEGGGE